MILNHNLVLNKIINFLSDYIKSSNKKSFIIKYNDFINSALIVYLCVQARKKCGATIYVTGSFPVHDLSVILDSVHYIGHKEDSIFDLADINNSLIVSSLDKTRGVITKKFHKYNDAADIYPILDLYYSEVIELIDRIFPENEFNKKYPDHELIEWVDREDLKTGIVSSNESPTNNKMWFKYTIPQKEMIAKLHQREKLTRHKRIAGRPFCEIRNMKEVR